MSKRYHCLLFVVMACITMGIVDAIIQPGYIFKSLIKIFVFISLSYAFSFIDKQYSMKDVLTFKVQNTKTAILVGITLYIIIVGGYLLFKDVFDFSNLTTSLNQTTGVNKDNFLFVAIYISFVNSFLEEYFFRGFAFLTLKKLTSRKFAYLFSSLSFALYHIAMMIGWYDIIVIIICLIALMIGGCIFNYFDEHDETIYMSWLIHGFANLATNTIGLLLFI